ncbi:MAG TPA: CHASE2 domain-containing protein [Chitinophagaceae bacterium]|nr:CHASE2 domain-containing protein [Chitinophagaceae bacterium]
MKKPLHKHIGQGAKRVGRHFTKYLYERDTIFATVWVFIFIVGLSNIPLNLYVLNPLKMGLKDFDYTDLAYAELKKGKDSKIDSNIVIINIGHADRELLSMIIDKTAENNPKVMALDAVFYEPGDSQPDSLLSASIGKHKNLIAATKLILSGKDGDTISTSGDYFKNAATYGYVNFFSDELASLRYYDPFMKDYKGTTYNSFTSAIIQAYDPAAFKKIKKKEGKQVQINYERTVDKYQVIEYENLLTGSFERKAIEGKIALLGYINRDPSDILDKKFTPMNERFAGKSRPDMNGIVAHANIISMVLGKNYIKKVPSWVNLLISIVVCWLFMSFFIRYYLENHIWFHLVAKVIQVAAVLLFAYLGIFCFDEFNIKLDMKLSLIVIIMAVDVIYFYEAWAVWMHKKFHYHTIFKPHHH